MLVRSGSDGATVHVSAGASRTYGSGNFLTGWNGSDAGGSRFFVSWTTNGTYQFVESNVTMIALASCVVVHRASFGSAPLGNVWPSVTISTRIGWPPTMTPSEFGFPPAGAAVSRTE